MLKLEAIDSIPLNAQVAAISCGLYKGNAVLDLAEHYEFARPLVNSGRLSVPAIYDGSPLNGDDDESLPIRTRPGAPYVDAPLEGGWLGDQLGNRFQLLAINCDVPEMLDVCGIGVETLKIDTSKHADKAFAERYLGAQPSAVYLMRPDQHVAARWCAFDETKVRAAVARATGRG